MQVGVMGRWLMVASLVLFNASAQAQDEALCAEVKIEIAQELTLERQGFEAVMRITNPLDTFALTDVSVNVLFTDADGNPVVATSDTQASSAAFFIRVDDSQGFSVLHTADDGRVEGGEIAAKSVGELRWLIIPTANAAAQKPEGKLYYVGAELRYSYGGKDELVTVAPDGITVKPQPKLALNYFLTEEVIADDAFTQAIEPPVPYTLGVRLLNSGHGPAGNVSIESAQPTIVENEQGLAIDFRITDSYVGNAPAVPSLLMNFGDIAPGGVVVGRWVMESSLSGKFTAFNASFAHADEFGGQLTSLVTGLNTQLLVRDVQVDLPGRDNVRDFLASSGVGGLRVFESEATGLDEVDCSHCIAVETLDGQLGGGNSGVHSLTASSIQTAAYIKVADPYAGAQALVRVQRSDGKLLPAANAWLSKERADDKINFNYFINVFDTAGPGNYTLTFGDLTEQPAAPVLQAINDRTSYEGGQVGFLVQASDPNGTVPALTAKQLPAGANFNDKGTGTGVFQWFPAVGQAGSYPITFVASDGKLQAERSLLIQINPADDKDGDGLNDAWELSYFGDLSRDGNGDYDGDGLTDRQESELGTDPTIAQSVPGEPGLVSPEFNQEILAGAQLPLLPLLTISNAPHAQDAVVSYQFEMYSDAALSQKVAAAAIPEGVVQTEWQLAAEHFEEGQSIADNQRYYWRVRAFTAEQVPGPWVPGQFFVNTQNDAPTGPVIVSPVHGATVATLKPTLLVANATDPDGDTLSYRFDLYLAGDNDPMQSLAGVLPGAEGQTQWTLPNSLAEDSYYRWQITVTDEHGASSHASAEFLVSTANHGPAAPAVLAPVDGARVNSLPGGVLLLTAVPVNDPEGQPVSYVFELDTQTDFTSAGKRQSPSLSLPEWQVDALEENQRYFWRVKASDGALDSSWQQAQFQLNLVNEKPGIPTLNNPGQDQVVETLQPTFDVNPVIDPDGDLVQYRFALYDDAALTSPLLTVVTSSTQWQPDFNLADNSHFYWRVQAQDEFGLAGDWSAAQHFMTNLNGIDDAPQFSFVNPDSDQLLGNELLIQWQDQDPDSAATIALYYYFAGIKGLIVAGLPEDGDGAADQYLWDTSGLPSGSYQLSAEITDASQTIIVNHCCTLTKPGANKTVVASLANDGVMDEADSRWAAVDVVLSEAVAAGEQVTLNLQLSNSASARIVGLQYLYFDANNWQIPQRVYVAGKDNCSVEGDRALQLQFLPAISGDAAYDGVETEAIDLTLVDNELADQSLYVCAPELVAQSLPDADGKVVSSYRVRIKNQGVSVTGASAQASLLSNTHDPVLATLVEGSDTLSFGALPANSAAYSSDLLKVQHPAGVVWPAARTAYFVLAGSPTDEQEGSESNNVLHGTAGNDIINGHGGNDTIYGGDGDDLIVGGSGADTLYGEAGNDTFGIEGNDPYADKISGGDGYDRIVGAAGDDSIRLSTFTGDWTVEEIDGGSGLNVIYGTDSNNTLDFSLTLLRNIDHIDALAGNDTVIGSAGDDRIVGGAGNDTINGGAGNDEFWVAGSNQGFDQFMGGEGVDRIIGSAGDDVIGLSRFENDYTVEVIDGSGGVNTLIGTNSNNRFDFSATELVNILHVDGAGGNDTIRGSQGPDTLIGGMGSDKLYGEAGDDVFVLTQGDEGFDRYSGGDGTDRILGSGFDDVIRLVEFNGAASAEIIDGDGGYNTIVGNDSRNILKFHDVSLIGIAMINGGGGNDLIHGSQADDVIEGGAGSDTLYGEGGDDLFLVTAGDEGFDKYFGGDGVDTLQSPATESLIRIARFEGSGRVERIVALGSPQWIVGKSDNTIFDFGGTELINIAGIRGEAGNDQLYGSSGNDVLVGGDGSDWLYGQEGDDTFLHVSEETGFDRFDGGPGYDQLLGTDADDQLLMSSLYPSNALELIDGRAGHNEIVGNDANNQLNFTDTELRNIHLIDGRGGNDTIRGSQVDDIIRGGVGSDFLSGQGGDDTFLHDNDDAHADTYNGGDGFDQLLGTSGDDLIRLKKFVADDSVERIDGQGGNDLVLGTNANNQLDFTLTEVIGISRFNALDGNDTLKGTAGDDWLEGGMGADWVVGNAGDDVIVHTAGDLSYNRYSGGEGTDRILGTDEDDVIGLSVFSGADTVEIIDGGAGSNIIQGSSSNNVFEFGGTQLISIQRIDTGAGNDYLEGSEQDDVLEGGLGSDRVYGRAGDDTFLITAGDTGADSYFGDEGFDQILGTEGDDVIRLSGFAPARSIERIDGGAGVNTIQAPDSNTVLDFSATALLNISAVLGGAGNDSLTGSVADDIMAGGAGADYLKGHDGNDTFLLSGADEQADRYNGGEGIDSVLGTEIDDFLILSHFAGDDSVEVIDLGIGTNFIRATSGNNTLDFSNTQLLGITGIYLLEGNDRWTGSADADTVVGGKGNDYLVGGQGDDVYVFEPGDGQDTMVETGSGNRIILPYHAPEDVWLVANGAGLTVYLLGSNDQIKVADWTASSNALISAIDVGGRLLDASGIEQLVTWMTAHGVPTGGVVNLTPEQLTELTALLDTVFQ
ncbi:putative Ig domain-containing protein [Simiduia agarivorans]|uniref:Ca2+-binding protein n=1 Tax=Simiduia agarivorans (strain DSM 21679 / JCM 13881 / BCRC 17597 / SA1) TaxID=1117647 RepID=K4KUF1_SIMAS|nr:putative Ig domain-containing protein [Simiduia agarivorans]AFU97592.1 Ca2+-binding protein [Simiduia agarivorans SA1 = DSM 21679]